MKCARLALAIGLLAFPRLASAADSQRFALITTENLYQVCSTPSHDPLRPQERQPNLFYWSIDRRIRTQRQVRVLIVANKLGGHEEIGGGAPMGPRSNGVRRRLHIASIATGKPGDAVTLPIPVTQPPRLSGSQRETAATLPCRRLSPASWPCCFGLE